MKLALVVGILACLAFANAGVPAFGTATADVPVAGSGSAPAFGSRNDHDDQAAFDPDHEINDHARFEDQADTLRGTWSISGQGVSQRPQVTDMCALVAVDGEPVIVDVDVRFVGLICFDGRSGCTMELEVETSAETFIVRSKRDHCVVVLSGEGQGFIDAQLETIAGCDAQGVFPTRFVATFVVGHNGELDFILSGCPFGFDATVAYTATSTTTTTTPTPVSDSFGCVSKSGIMSRGDGSSVEGLVPISASGEIERQNGQRRNKHDERGPGGLSTTDATTSGGISGPGRDDKHDDKNKRREDESCDAFRTFRSPFNLDDSPQCPPCRNGGIPGVTI
jgi:hypothetical protein